MAGEDALMRLAVIRLVRTDYRDTVDLARQMPRRRRPHQPAADDDIFEIDCHAFPLYDAACLFRPAKDAVSS